MPSSSNAVEFHGSLFVSNSARSMTPVSAEQIIGRSAGKLSISSARVRRSSARIKTFSLTSATYTDALPFALTIFLQGYAPAAPGGGRCRAEIATAVELSKSGATHNDGEPVRFAR